MPPQNSKANVVTPNAESGFVGTVRNVANETNLSKSSSLPLDSAKTEAIWT